MILILTLAVALLLVAVAMYRSEDPQWRHLGRRILLWGGLGLVLLLVVTGRLHWLLGLLAAALPLVRRLLPLLTLLPSMLRRFRGHSRQGTEGNADRQSGDGPMSLAEARAILGVDEHADERTIIAAHRRLMQKIHPDRGGSAYLARRINEARRRLLER